MLSLVEYAREIKGVTDFLIFPQNGEALANYSEYVQVVSRAHVRGRRVKPVWCCFNQEYI